jgi:hypothetical protein
MNMGKTAGKWSDVFRIVCSVDFHLHPAYQHLTTSRGAARTQQCF